MTEDDLDAMKRDAEAMIEHGGWIVMDATDADENVRRMRDGLAGKATVTGPGFTF